MTDPPNVVGIDLSLTCTGIATIAGDGRIELATVKSNGLEKASLVDRAKRSASVWDRVSSVIPEGAVVIVEAPAYSTTLGQNHDRSGLWWLVVMDIVTSGRTVVEVTPATLKKYATGRGNADKMAVRDAAHDRLGVRPDTHDEADALWLAAIGRDLIGSPLATMPASHRAALARIRMPVTT